MKRNYFFSIIILISIGLNANNIKVSNVTLTGQDPVNNFTLVQFDLSWENSWRLSSGPANWDAAWVFIKFRADGGSWRHATLNYVNGTAANDGHTQPAGSIIKTASDGKGCFIYRDAVGSGNVNWTGVQLKWDYGSNFVTDEAMIDIEVIAIEMVYIPQGSFTIGHPSAGTDRFYRTDINGVILGFYSISNENAITVSATGGLYYDNLSPSYGGDAYADIPANFPKGFDAFYVMKYEVSEEQYVEFYNMHLNSAYDITDASGKNTDAVTFRNTISINPADGAYTSAPSRPVSYVNWKRFAAYLDWCALRPFTELEYEKMCTNPSTVELYPWNTIYLSQAQRYTIIYDGTDSARITNLSQNRANANYSVTSPVSAGSGPVRVGIFAASAVTKNRVETGGSYFGVMELGGNLLERCISVGHSDNRVFIGDHGDGDPGSISGLSWPALTSSARAYRGGSHKHPSQRMNTQDRYYGCIAADLADESAGIRGARTAE